jgi:poly-gamma-glutamate synthesis protein (capsule biosynthesis protein)
MQVDIERLRESVDVLTVALHKGLVHTPVKLAMYERPIARAAIDAGADVVVGHHAHILHGVEVYRGRPIFHGLGNFATVTRVLNVEGNPDPAALDWANRRRELFGFEPDPDYSTYAFHPEAKNTMIAVCEVGRQGVIRAGFIPCWVNQNGVPEVLGHDERGERVTMYVERITREAGLSTEFRWGGDQVWFLS